MILLFKNEFVSIVFHLKLPTKYKKKNSYAFCKIIILYGFPSLNQPMVCQPFTIIIIIIIIILLKDEE